MGQRTTPCKLRIWHGGEEGAADVNHAMVLAGAPEDRVTPIGNHHWGTMIGCPKGWAAAILHQQSGLLVNMKRLVAH